MNCVSCDICGYHLWFVFFFPGVFLSSRVTGAYPVTTVLGMGVHVTTTTLHGERPPAIFNFQARASQLRCNLSNNSGSGAIIDTYIVGLGSIALVSLHARWSSSDSNPDSRLVGVCSRLPCGSYGAGIPIAVGCGRELVSCGNWGTLRCS